MNMRTNLLKLILLFVIMAPVVAFAGVSGPSPIPPPPNFQLSTTVITLCKGMINRVPIEIKTPAGASIMQDVQLSLTNSRYAYTVGNGSVSAVNVTANMSNVVNLPVFVSLNSTPLVSAGIAINYQYDTLYSDSEVRNISFGIETCANPLKVAVSPDVLTSGKIENITFNFTNIGAQSLNYLSIHAALPSTDGTFLGIQPIQITTIAPHSSVRLNQSVFVYKNATQSFPVNLSISLYNGTSLEQISDNPIVLSTGIINISASSITLSPTVPTAGSIFSISFVLTDVGTSAASAVRASAAQTPDFSNYGANSVFVGDVAVDTQTPVTLTLTADSAVKSGNYTIPIKISYLNSLRENLSTVIDVPVTVGAAVASNSLTTTQLRHSSGGGGIIIIVLVIVIVLFAFLYYRERKRKK